MKNTKKLLSFVVLVFVLSIIGWFIVATIHTHEPRDLQVFTDIEDFSQLDVYVTRNIPLSQDTNLESLNPVAYYTKEISYDERSYRVYAYVFDSTQEAKTYFEHCTGKMPENDRDFSSSSSLFSQSSYVAFSGCYLYRVEGGSYRSLEEFLDFLTDTLPLT